MSETAKQFHTKPVSVEAAQLFAGTRQRIKDWLGDKAWFYDSNGEAELYVYGPDGTEVAKGGDWIVKRQDGEFLVVPFPVFNATYEVGPPPQPSAD